MNYADVAGGIALAAFIPYIIGILEGKDKPPVSTWGLWSILDSIVLWSMYKKDAASTQMILVVCGAWTVTAILLFMGKRTFDAIDIFCTIAVIFGLVLILLAKDSNVSLVVTCISIFLATIPMFRNAWMHPNDENLAAWIMNLVASTMTLCVAKTASIEHMAQPITFIACSMPMTTIIIGKRLWKAKTRR